MFPSTQCIKIEVNDDKVLKEKIIFSRHLTAYRKVGYFGEFKFSDSEETAKLRQHLQSAEIKWK